MAYLCFTGPTTDLQTIIGNLNACINSSSSTASSNCQPIVSAYNKNVTSAYDWYGTNLNGNGVSNNNFALQNTIALQYSGTTNGSGGTFPLDVIWVQGLPTATFSQTINSLPSGTTSPAGLPGLIAFVDQPYTWNISTPAPTNFNSPFAQLIPTTSSITTISTPTSSYIPYTYYLADYGSLGTLGWQLNTGAASTISYGNGATTVGFKAPPSITTVNGSNITGLSATAQFFGPQAGEN